MSAFLLGIPGKLKTLTDRLSAVRAALLDNLDATVSSRAPSTTALSTTNWTNGRAAALDAIASLPAGAVRSIQTGYPSVALSSTGSGEDVSYHDITITAIVGKALPLWFPADGQATTKYQTCRLTSSTNLRISCTTGVVGFKGRWYVIDFY